MTKIFVGSLPFSMTNQGLQSLFESFGKVTSASVIMDKFTGQSRGFGFVEMDNDEEAQKAITELNGYQVEGRSIAVSVARPREDRPSGGFQSGSGGGFRRDDRGGFDRNRSRR
ncbi:MAG: RNA-binding protein [Candidatus Daviesbacteria bacterium]